MSGGSRQPEDRRDTRCEHCHRCYRSDGIHGHEPTCTFRDVDAVVVPREQWDELDNDPEDREEGMGGQAPQPHDDPENGGVAVGSADDDPRGSDGKEAVADGSGLGLDGPPAPSTAPTPDDADVLDDVADDDDVDNDNEPEGLVCEECGDPFGVTHSELRERDDVGRAARLTCTCGAVRRWTDE